MTVRTYAPALSRSAFLETGGKSYKRYLQFLAKRRPGWDPNKALTKQRVGKTTFDDLLASVEQIETPAQLEARANRMAQTQQTYQQKLINQAYTEARKEALTNMQSLQAAGQAAARMNADLMGQVGKSYEGAAQGVTALGSGLGAAMSGATAADVAAANSALGGLGGTSPAVNVPEGQAAVETFRGATLPAYQLGQTSAAQQMGIGTLISAQNLRSTQEASAAFITAQRQAQTAKMGAIKELAAGRPQAAMQFLTQLQAAQRQQIALAQGLLGAKASMKQQGIENKLTTRKLNAGIAADKADAAAALAEIRQKAIEAKIEYSRIDASASRVAGYLIDKAGRPIMGRNKQVIPIHESASGKTGGLTPYQLTRQIEKGYDTARELYYGWATDAKGKRIESPEPGGTGSVDYDVAMQRLMSTGIPRLQARAILTQPGLYERGDAGRPIFWDYEIKAIKGALAKSFKGNKKKAETTFNAWRAQIIRLFNQAKDTDDDAEFERLNDMAESYINRLLGWGATGKAPTAMGPPSPGR